MNFRSSYRAWVHSITAETDVNRTQYVRVHLHEYVPGESSIETIGEPIGHPIGVRCSEVILERSAIGGLKVGDLVDVGVTLTPATVTTGDEIHAARTHGLKTMVDRHEAS